MRPTRLLPVVLAVAAGCALATQGGPPEDPDARLRLGLEALAQQDVVTAREHLEWVYRQHPSEPAGTYALLALTAAELDPRNPTRSLEAGNALAGELLHSPDAPDWARPVGQSFQLLAMEVAGKEKRMQQCQTALHGSEVNGQERLADVRAERDTLQGRVTSLQQRVTDLQKQLEEKDAELERIRKTIKG